MEKGMSHPSTTLLAKNIRLNVLKMVTLAKASHIGSCFSVIDLLAVLYGKILKYNPLEPEYPDRDRFILSKGHAGAAVYATLAEFNFFPKEWLNQFCQNESYLLGHLTHHHVPGVEFSTGSLGHGLSVACGMALAAKRDHKNYKVYVILSDGECNEGSIWEAAMFAAQFQLSNLVVLIDYNKIQSFGKVKDIMDLEPFAKKWEAFNWNVKEIDGHNHQAIETTLNSLSYEKSPNLIIAHTIKGKGVGFMEDQLMWHYKSPNEQQYQQAVVELEETLE
jgi:transketolase